MFRFVKSGSHLPSLFSYKSTQFSLFQSRYMATTSNSNLTYNNFPFLKDLGLKPNNSGVFNGKWLGSGETFTSLNPATNEPIATVQGATVQEYEETIKAMDLAKSKFGLLPHPVRGEIVRKIGEELRKYKEPLGKLVSLEMGKITSEGLGEVQEAIDICDYAVGLSRTLAGQVLPSERPGN